MSVLELYIEKDVAGGSMFHSIEFSSLFFCSLLFIIICYYAFTYFIPLFTFTSYKLKIIQ